MGHEGVELMRWAILELVNHCDEVVFLGLVLTARQNRDAAPCEAASLFVLEVS